MKKLRKEADPPTSIEDWGYKYHHTGIPTKQKLPGERYIEPLKFFVSGFSESPFGVEWMRFEEDSPIDPLIQKVPHVAFEVDDLEYELNTRNFKVITAPVKTEDHIKVAMIEHNGAPIELIEFSKTTK